MYKCERMIRPKCTDIDNSFKTNDSTERIFEIENSLFVISGRSGKTRLYERSHTLIIVFGLSYLFLTDVPTIDIVKDLLLIGTEARSIIVQMGPSHLRVVDIVERTH